MYIHCRNNMVIEMKIKIQKWGNSLAVRIPKSFASEVQLADKDDIELSIEKSNLVIKPLKKDKYKFDELVSKINESNIHYEVDFGKSEGKEIL